MATLDSAPGGQKTTYYSGDRLLISDQEDAGDSKYIETDVILTEARDKTGLTEKTTIVGADVSEINDSADTYSPKKVLKSTEKNFFMPHDYINEFQLKSNSTTWSSIDYSTIMCMVNGEYNKVASGTVTNGSTSANTWYAVWIKNNTVSITTCGWTGISGNQLNVYSALYDEAKGYCYDTTNGRLLAILKTNSGNTAYPYIIPIFNIPYTFIIADNNTGGGAQFINASTQTKIAYENILVDINSEWDGTDDFASKLNQNVWALATINGVSDNTSYQRVYYLYVNGYDLEEDTMAFLTVRKSMTGKNKLKVGDIVNYQINFANAVTITRGGGAYIRIIGGK